MLQLKWWQKLLLLLQRLVWLGYGSIESVAYSLYLFLSMPRNPFDRVRLLTNAANQTLDPNDTSDGIPLKRTVSWCTVASLDNVKEVARAFGPRVTVNDVWVACITSAVSRQLEDHRERLALAGKKLPVYRNINVVMPVHLTGGVLLPNQSLGNNIGAICVQVPGKHRVPEADDDDDDENRLLAIHKTLRWAKTSPTALLTNTAAQLSSLLPTPVVQYLFRCANANACVTISNVRQPPQHLHLCDHQYTVQNAIGFVPLPPGLPIGVVVQSYAGNMTLSVNAEPWAVPDADKFLMWVLEEYVRLQKHAQTKGKAPK